MHISTRTLVLIGAIVLVVAAGAVHILGGKSEGNTLRLSSPSTELTNDDEPSVPVPPFLIRSFPDTDFTNAKPAVEKILSGGPPKDGIPAIDVPEFVRLDTFEHSSSVQAIVMQHEDTVKVYPYNILTWHEIVNDTVDGTPVAITFCPLCGSAIVFERTVRGAETTFGVSGSLIESNMVMYDRATESLWQQSTGEGLAGEFVDERLELAPFQLLTMGEVAQRYPDALLLSEDTGHQRDYARNPYSGYEEDNERFVFGISDFDPALPSKEIMVAFRVGETPVATSWNQLAEGDTMSLVDGQVISLRKQNGELTITNESGEEIPFYFEMWFSFSVQHGESAVVI